MSQTYKIRSIGGALLITIPQHIVRAMELQAGDEMVIQAFDVGRKHGMITAKPVKPTAKGRSK